MNQRSGGSGSGRGIGPVQQPHAHGGQLWPAAHAGQAHPQPPPPLPGTGVVFTHAPVGQGVVMQTTSTGTQPQPLASALHDAGSAWTPQVSAGWGGRRQRLPRHSIPCAHGTPSPYQRQRSVVSAWQVATSRSFAHGSTTGSGGGIGHVHGAHAVSGGHVGHTQPRLALVPPTIVASTEPPPRAVPSPALVTPTEPPPHAQSQAGHAAPAMHAGQAQVQVPPPVPHEPSPPLAQSHVHGGQRSPAAHAGHAQVQVPPPPPPSGGGRQSQATSGHAPLSGHASGRAQLQPPPDASRTWQ
jgi:hypothetical protein